GRARPLQQPLRRPLVGRRGLIAGSFAETLAPRAGRAMLPAPARDPVTRALPPQVIRIGERRLALPAGVTVLHWAPERINYQNPRIRAFRGSLRLIRGILESNSSLLHCPPERLHDIGRKVRKLMQLIRGEIAPLLSAPPRLPRLEEAREGAELSLR